MEKLQLYMTMSQSDYREMLTCNASEVAQSSVCDLREAVSQVNYDPSRIAIFYMLKYIENGFFVIIFRTIPNVIGNHLASWVYVPYGINMPGNELFHIVQFIADKVSKTQVTGSDVAEIRQFFSREYPVDSAVPFYPAMDPMGTVAFRSYGPMAGIELSDLLGRYRFQASYLSYSGILLVDQAITTDVTGNNLTSASLEDMAVIFPPKPMSGYQPTIYGQPFDVPYAGNIGHNAEVVWVPEQSGQRPIRQTFYVAQSEMTAPSMAGAPAWNSGANSQYGASAQPLPAPSTQQSASSPFGQAQRPSGMPPQHKKTYRFQIPSKSMDIGSMIEFEITTNGNLVESPIDGYEPTADIQEGIGRSNQLLYKSVTLKQKILNNGLYLLIGLVAGFFIGWLSTCSSDHPNKPQPAAPGVDSISATEVIDVQQPEEPAKAEVATAAPAQAQPAGAAEDVSLAAAINYLDSNKDWEKDQMEKYPDLRGLFDDMNNIKRQVLVEKWGPKLQESRTFQLVARHSKLSYKKKARSTPFLSPTAPQTIKVQAYLNNIDP